MKERFTKQIPIIFFSLLFFNTALAEVFVSAGNGNWTNSSNWTYSGNPSNTIPGINDEVIIDGHEITINSDVGEVKSITVKTNNVIGNSKLILIQGAHLTTIGELVVEAPDIMIDTEVTLSGNAILNIGTSVTFSRLFGNTQDNMLRLHMVDSSSMFVGSTFTFNYNASGTGEQTDEILLENKSHLTIVDNSTITVSAGKNFQMIVNGDAIVDFNGMLSGNIYDGNLLKISAINGGTINVGKDINLHNYNSAIGITLATDIDGVINVDSSIYMNSYVADKEITLITSGSTESTMSIGKNISISAQSEGDILINLLQGKLEIAGNFQRPTDFGSIAMGETASLIYNGTTPQTLACNIMPNGGTDVFDLKNIEFDNPSGMITEGPLRIKNEMDLGRGTIETSAANPIIITDGATIVGGSSNAFISGPIHKEGSTNGSAFIFPTGKGDTYAPIEVSAVSEVGSVIIAEYKGDPPPYIENIDDGIGGIQHISSMEHWTLTRTGGTENIQVALHWTDASTRGIDDLSSLVVAQFNSVDNTWYNSGIGDIKGSLTTPGSVETGDPPPYIEAFTFASTMASTNSLPVEMTRFEARKDKDNNVHLSWETASELNSDYFTVERSENGLDFYPLHKVKSKGTTNVVSSYSTVDKDPFYGMNYYRLRQVDLDGTESFSDALVIKFDIKSAVLLFPNPVLDDINIRLENEFEKEVLIEIFDQSGRLIFAEKYQDVSKYMKLRAIQANITNRGTYFMKIHTSSETIIQKFMAGY